MQTLPPLVAAGVRHAIAGSLLVAWLIARGHVERLRVDRARLAGAALVGTLLLGGGNGLVMMAERTVPSGLTALIIASVPLWIVVFRRIAGDEIPTSVTAGVLVGFLGVAALVTPRGDGDIDPIGLTLVFAATLSWALGPFASPRLRMPRDPLSSPALQSLAGGAVLLVVGSATGELSRLDPARFSTGSLAAIAYLVVFGSLVAFSAYTWLLQHAPVSMVATYAYVNPVVAVVLGSLVLSEPVTPTMLAGAAVILAAVAFIVRRSSQGSGSPSGRARP